MCRQTTHGRACVLVTIHSLDMGSFQDWLLGSYNVQHDIVSILCGGNENT